MTLAHARSAVLLSVVLLMALSPAVRARVQVADPRISALLLQAERLSDALNLDDALARVDEAIALAEKLGYRTELAMSYQTKGVVFARLGRSKDAVAFHERALAGFEALGNKPGVARVSAALASSFGSLGDFPKQDAHAKRAFELYAELGNDVGRARLLIVLSASTPAYRLTEAQMTEILAIADRSSDDVFIGEAYRLRANSFFNRGDYAQARTAYEKAIAAFSKTENVESLAAAYLAFGRVFRAHGDYEGAMERYQKAIDLLAPTKERYTIVESYNAKAIALGYLGRSQESLEHYERGLALARESNNQRMIDFMEGNLAGALVSAKQFDRAIPALEAILARNPEPNLAGYRHLSLAQALTSSGRAKEATAHIDESVRIARDLKQTESLSIRLSNRAWILTETGRLEDALADVRESLAITEQIRTTLIPSDFLKRGFGDRVQVGFGHATDLLSRLGRPSEALEFAERGRARAFLDLLAARESAGDAAAKPSTDLASASIGAPVNYAGMTQIAARLKATLVTFWVSDDAVAIWVISPGSEPAHIRVPMKRADLAALVSATTAPLRESETTTTTTRGPDGSSDGATDLAALPMRGLGVLALSRDSKTAWKALHKTLIEPVRAQLPPRGGRVTIIPHGPLFQLSFGALQDPAGRYLLEDYELHYAPAISALAFTGRRQTVATSNAAAQWTVVGNPATLPSVGGRSLPPLPGAAREIAAVAAFAPKGATTLTGAGADEAGLARALVALRPSLLHFATHGFVFDSAKEPPFLALNRRGTTAAEDGRLTLDEVYGLRLSTDLVVLSACRTGTGQASSDGILSLTRGFFYAGSPSVMATLWDVSDETTTQLMSGFYRGYAKTGAKAASLRGAQLKLMADLRAGRVVVTLAGRRLTLPEHPLLWAGFFLTGEP